MNFFSWKFGQIFQRGMLFSTGVLSIWSITFMLLWHAKLHIRCLYETFMNSIFFLLEKISYIRCEDLCKIYVMSPCYLLLVVKLKISTENMCISLEIQVFWWKRAEKSWEVAFISRIGSFFLRKFAFYAWRCSKTIRENRFNATFMMRQQSKTSAKNVVLLQF